MIVSTNGDAAVEKFEGLLELTVNLLDQDGKIRPEFYLERDGTQFEPVVLDKMNECARGSPFEGTLVRAGVHQFPDIIAKKFYGVEVKTSLQDHWKSTGNSVLESNRIKSVERIYILFGKLFDPPAFRFKRYEDCLYDVRVTHSPRYLIDMDTEPEQTIFSKIEIPYDNLRRMGNPILPFIKYFRKDLKPGDDVWWLGTDMPVNVRHWSNLRKSEKDDLRNQAMATFPEVFGTSSQKYKRLATWLVTKHAVVNPSLRDPFSAGGQVEMEVGGRTYFDVPRVFQRLKDNLMDVLDCVGYLDPNDIEHYWGTSLTDDGYQEKVDIWLKLVHRYSRDVLRGSGLSVGRMLKDALDS